MLLDTNILIYLSKPGGESLQEVFSSTRPVASLVSKIEAYGYHRITEQEVSDLNIVFGWVAILSISEQIANRAIRLRQERHMTLGDAVIAATAFVHGVPLCTRNVQDFKHIEGMEIQNPFDE